MLKIRQIRYSVDSISVQVYKIVNRKRKIVRHIGTGRNNQEVENLLALANDFINKESKQLVLFKGDNTNNTLLVNQTEFLGVYYNFIYDLISKVILQIGLDKINNSLLIDLVILRIIEPASKLRSIELLKEYFGINHRRQNFYKEAPQWASLKVKVEKKCVEFAKRHYDFKYDLLFYDVTTLYFETFKEDELRKNGFSKDNKPQQPQIVVALMVSKEGFPISYDVFTGNTFEGHTIMPVIEKFKKDNKVQNFTVVADAAMISSENILNLMKNNINYIVGARLGNIPNKLLDEIDKNIVREDGNTIRIKTDKGYLICSYSSLRYRKDEYEMKKQIEKAELIVDDPSKNRKVKFTKTNEQKIELNQKLIDKTKKLLGIKGYYTDLEETVTDNKTIIERYHELYKIEQAFRIAKNDLHTRPIYHFEQNPIKLHLLICFMALATSKHIELKTKMSIKKFVQECKKITDARLKNKITGKEFIIRVDLDEKTKKILSNFNLLT